MGRRHGRRLVSAETTVSSKGKQKRIYRWYATPWEILRQLPGLAKFLRSEVDANQLQRIAGTQTDTQAAEEMQAAKRKLFASAQPTDITAISSQPSFISRTYSENRNDPTGLPPAKA